MWDTRENGNVQSTLNSLGYVSISHHIVLLSLKLLLKLCSPLHNLLPIIITPHQRASVTSLMHFPEAGLLLLIESQNHYGWKRPLWSPSPTQARPTFPSMIKDPWCLETNYSKTCLDALICVEAFIGQQCWSWEGVHWDVCSGKSSLARWGAGLAPQKHPLCALTCKSTRCYPGGTFPIVQRNEIPWMEPSLLAKLAQWDG